MTDFEYAGIAEQKKILMVMPESLGDIILVTALFSSLKEQYPEYLLCFSCKNNYIEYVMENPVLDFVIPYSHSLEAFQITEGSMHFPKMFDIVFCPHFLTQRAVSYVHNGQTRIALDLEY